MPSTGTATSTGTNKTLSPGPAPVEPGSKIGKSGSMKIKRTASGAKMLPKSKSSGSLKKKAEKAEKGEKGDRGEQCLPGHSPRPPAKEGRRVSSSTSGEADVPPGQKQNGSLRRGGGGDREEEGDGEEEEVWEEEKKEASIKGLWKKAVKTMKNPGSDSKWLNRPSFKRRDSKHTEEEAEEEEPKEIDPVYSLLKCAADLPKITRSLSKEGAQPSGGCQGAHCFLKAPSPQPQGVPHLTSSGSTSGACCRGHHQKSEASSSHSLGHDFKEFYKQTSPIKRLSSHDLGI